MDDVARSEDLSVRTDVNNSDELGRLEIHLCKMVNYLASAKQEVTCAKQEATTLAANFEGTHSDDSNTDGTINWDLLVDKLGDEETLREVLPFYSKDIREHFDKLSVAVINEDCASIASHAHPLKGVGRNLGVERLSDIAGQMECAGKQNDIEASTLLLNGLKIEIDQVLAGLSQRNWIDEPTTYLKP
ncbi:MAG: Hpt domain-containing protein [Planctomycetes bacterium]|nr:Hpt domain-containing protein [Planctomycetota bacterium]